MSRLYMHAGEESDPANAAARLRPHKDVVSQRLGEAGVLIDMRSGRMFELNVTGIRIWELVGEGCSPDDAAARLLQEFAGDPLELRAEVGALVEELVREGLLDAEHRG
jgi:hypothetical protein